MGSSERQALLGRLVYELGWLTRQGEPTATRALAVMLEEPVLKDATLSFLGALTDRDLREVARFEAERIHEDNRRTDLEGLDSCERPVLIVEAKFSAVFGTGQLHDYLADQARRLEGTNGALVLLVPEDRKAEGRRLLEAEAGTHDIGVAVVTWKEWFDRWDEAATAEPDGLRSIKADLIQLRDMCTSLGAFVIEPLAEASFGPAWRNREGDLREIVHQVTVALNAVGDSLPPIVHVPGFDPSRYVPAGNGQSSLAVGVASKFADNSDDSSPIWVRFHKHTPYFKDIKKKILSSEYHAVARHEDGHLWIPLVVDAGLAGPELVADLLEQVHRIQAVVQ